MSIIGKRYKPNDNSYSLCLSCSEMKEDKIALAGNAYNEIRKICEVISEPYSFEVESVTGRWHTHKFVNVKYNKHIYRVLYNEVNIIDNHQINRNSLIGTYDAIIISSPLGDKSLIRRLSISTREMNDWFIVQKPGHEPEHYDYLSEAIDKYNSI